MPLLHVMESMMPPMIASSFECVIILYYDIIIAHKPSENFLERL